MGYLYRHIRLDKNEPFYIGIGGFDRTEKEGTYKRAYNENRNSIWKNIVSKTDYEVEIMLDNLTFEEACEKEKEFISIYGRINLNTGCLSNLTNGGEGTLNYIITEETRNKMSESRKGEKNHMYGKSLIPWNKGKTGLYTLSIKTKELISQKLKGRVSPKKGKKDSDETIKKKKGKIPVNKNACKYDILLIKDLINKGLKYREITNLTGAPAATISRIKNITNT